MLQPFKTKVFEKDQKRAKKQNRDFSELIKVMGDLIREKPLEPKYNDHPLKGNWVGCRD